MALNFRTLRDRGHGSETVSKWGRCSGFCSASGGCDSATKDGDCNRFAPYNRAVRVSALFVAVALSTSSGAASPLSADISVLNGAVSCPDSRELHATVEHIVQRPLLPTSPADTVFATVSFRRAGTGFAALVQLTGAKQGERWLTDTGESCAPLAQAVAVTLALLVDSRPAPASSTADLRSHRSRGALSLGLGSTLGLQPSAGLAFDAALEVKWPRWSVHAGGVYLQPRDAELGPGRVSVRLAWADVLLCRLLSGGPALQLDACAAGAAGWLSGQGEGYPEASQAGFFWSSLGAAIRLGGPLGERWLWAITTEGLVPLEQHSFSVGNLGVAYRSDRVGGLARLHLGVRLW